MRPSLSDMDWLLDSDPAIRWQALRDLADAPDDVVAAERARVATEGWGARLLVARDTDGQWIGGACFPGGGTSPRTAATVDVDAPGHDGLRDFGLDPVSAKARETTALVAANCRWEYDGPPFFDGEVEPCINGRTVTLGAYFGADVDGIVTRLLADQLDDGGWNCWTEVGATVSSFDSTICVLEGLLEHERAAGGSAELTAARRGGEEYLLERSLFRRKSTGEVPVDAWLRSRSRPGGTTTSCVGWTTSGRPTSGTRGSPRRSSSCGPSAGATAPGCSRTPTPAQSTSSSRTATAARAGGTRCGRPACSTGGTRAADTGMMCPCGSCAVLSWTVSRRSSSLSLARW